jgi:HEAT repeat protein
MLAAWTKLLALVLVSVQVAQAAPIDRDREILKAGNVGTGTRALVVFLLDEPQRGLDVTNVPEFIQDLGAARSQSREVAVNGLVAIGPAAVPALRLALAHQDPEIVGRARTCLERIPREWDDHLAVAAIRILLRERPPGALGALLHYLPFATPGGDVEELLWYGLDRMVDRGKPVDPALVRALHDGAAARRALAGCLLARKGTATDKLAARKLLADPDPMVKLRTAQGFLAARDVVAIPVLLDLLVASPIEIAWQAEELLSWTAGDEFARPTIGAGGPELRQRCRATWDEWWKQGAGVPLQHIDERSRGPGLLLVAEGDISPTRSNNRIWLCGWDKKPRWQLEGLNRIVDMAWSPWVQAGGLCLAQEESRHGFWCARSLDGKLLWRHEDTHSAPDSPILSRANVILKSGARYIGQRNSFVELDYDGNAVKRLSLETREYPIFSPQLTLDGRIGGGSIKERTRILEIDPSNKFNATLIPGSPLPGTVFSVQALGLGYLVALADDASLLQKARGAKTDEERSRLEERIGYGARLVELDDKGKIIWQCRLPFARWASRLPNGNTLALHSNGVPLNQEINCVVEINAEGHVVWELTTRPMALYARNCFGLVRLGFEPATIPPPEGDPVAYAVRLLKDGAADNRRRGAALLIDKKPAPLSAIPYLLDAADGRDASVERLAADALASMGKEAVPELAKALKSKEPRRASVAGTALGKMKANGKDIVPLVLPLLKDQNLIVREDGIRVLRLLGSSARSAVPALTDMLQEPDTAPRTVAARILENIGEAAEPAVPALVQSLSIPDSGLRTAVAKALGRVQRRPELVVPALLPLVKDERLPMLLRAEAAWAIGSFRPLSPDVDATFFSLLRATSPRDESRPHSYRYSLIRGLGQVEPVAPSTVEVLIQLAQDHNEAQSIRRAAIAALGSLGPQAKEATAMLQGLSEDPDRSIREQARGALNSIVNPRPKLRPRQPPDKSDTNK